MLDALPGHVADDDALVIRTTVEIFRAFLELCYWVSDSLAGVVDASRHVVAAKAHVVLAEEHLEGVAFTQFRAAVQKVFKCIATASDLAKVKEVAALIALIPIPPLLLGAKDPFERWAQPSRTESPPNAVTEVPPALVAKVMFELDGQPWSTPQVVRANLVHDLTATVTIPYWPEEADYLLIDYVTTLPPEHYRLTEFRIDRSNGDPVRETTMAGHAEFPIGQSVLSEPALIQLRARFRSSKDAKFVKPATVIGYHKLRVRISDADHTSLLSRYPAIDERIVEIVDEVREKVRDINQEHLSDFVTLLGSVTNYMGICAQQALYREGKKISEAEFQADLLTHLRRLLGVEVREAPKQGGGPTDIQYRTVIAELKVEGKIADREKLVAKYVAQPTQYSSGMGAQLGILCILDLTEKERPPANPKNNILMRSVPVHGFAAGDEPHPTLIAVVVIDGNLRLPSSYSH